MFPQSNFVKQIKTHTQNLDLKNWIFEDFAFFDLVFLFSLRENRLLRYGCWYTEHSSNENTMFLREHRVLTSNKCTILLKEAVQIHKMGDCNVSTSVWYMR